MTLCRHASRERRGQRPDGTGDGGGHRKLWAFSWEDLAVLFGVSVRTVQSWSKPRNPRLALFDPTDLESIVRLYNKRKEDAYRRLLNRGAHKLPRRDSPQFGPEDEYGNR